MAARAYDLAAGVEHEGGGGAQHVETAHQRQVVRHVELDVHDTGALVGEAGEHPGRRPARGADLGRELDEGGLGPQADPELVGPQRVVGRDGAHPPLPRTPRQAERCGSSQQRGHEQQRTHIYPRRTRPTM
ncbi:hypothetical protein [Cellulomonas citrea]|uniref:hypothetical protein n=1 Tax=Cellulomonas citrea TaxID=1909423 RepID=UPI0013588D08|nr:hypothetical protein [Cellulomonas citrea]